MTKEMQIDGISLTSKRWNLEYVPEGIPKKRGNNLTVPFMDGARWVKKSYEQRTDNLNLWVLPKDENGSLLEGKTEAVQLEENIEYLKQLFGVSGLITIDKKMNDGTWRIAKAEIVDTLEFERKSETDRHRVFSVGLQFPDPFWYAATQEIETFTPNAVSYETTHQNPGTAENRKMKIFLTGGLTNPRIENTTTGVFLKLNDTITSGTTVTIDTEKFTVTDQAGNNLLNSLIHSGDMAWLSLAAGANSLKITTDEAPSGRIEFKYYPAYF